MEFLLDSLALVLQPSALAYLALGLVAGFVVGVLPGFGSSNAAAVALPLSLGLPVEQALMLMISIYAGATYAGSVPAILLNVPGEAGSAATAIDGYPLTQQGKGAMAIGVARLASAIGGIISMTIVIAIIGPLSRFALAFGQREMVLVIAFGLLIIGGLISHSPAKGMLSAALGILIGSMAASPVTGQPRFTFGFNELYEGVPFVAALIGLFAFAEMFQLASKESITTASSGGSTAQQMDVGVAGFVRRLGRDVKEGFAETLRHPRALLRSSLIGMLVGIVPGTGASVGNFLSYGAARRASKNPELFGKGAVEGVIGSEAADNGVASGTLVPMLALGIPGSGTSAVMIGALILHGVPPGPRLLTDHQTEAYAILIGAMLASVLILPLGVVLAAPMMQITRVRPSIIVPVVLILSCAGVFAGRSQLFDIWLAFVFGVLGFFMLRYGYPVIPLVIGLILGPLGEAYLMRALRLGGNELSYFFGSPLAVALWVLLAAVTIATITRSVRRR